MSKPARRASAPPRHPLSLAIAIAGALVAVGAQAQDAPTANQEASAKEPSKPAAVAQFETITVTAQKREQQIQDVPIAISAYSSDFLEQYGMANYQDIGALVPGLEIQMQSVTNPSLSIRGITADLDDPTQEPRISVFQDGVSLSRSRGAFVEPFDLERVEVLRGPQGTLFGRAAEIGAIHFIQNKARDETSGAFELGAGNFDERKFTGYYNTTLGENVYGRIAAFYETRDGYVDNAAGGTLQGKDTRALRGSLHFNVGEGNALDLILNYEKDQPPGTAFRSMVIPNRQGSLDPYRADAQRGDGLGTDRDVYGTTLLGYFPLSTSWTLNTITGWRRYDSLDRFDADGSQADLIEFDEHAWGRQLSQEFRLNYDNGGTFTGFAGVSFFDEKADRDLAYQADERQLYDLFSPLLNAASGGLFPVVPLLNPDGSPFTGVSALALPTPLGVIPLPLNPDHHETFGNDSKVRSTEVFADGTWRLDDRWELTLGVRGTHESATYGYHADPGNYTSLGFFLSGRTVPACTNPFASCTNLLYPATAGRLSDSDSWDSWVGRAVVRYKFDDNNSAYASVSRGRRPAMLQVNDLGNSEIPAEIVWSYEVGLKGSTAGGGLAYDLAAYYYDYSNFQAQVQNPAPPPFLVVTNAGRANAAGFEASLFARFSEHVRGFLNYGYINGGFNALDDQGNVQALAGNKFRMTPENSLALGLDVTVPMAGDRRFFFRPSVTWRSKVFFEDENNPPGFAGRIQQSGYGLLNLRAGVEFDEHWTLTASVDNATDEKYLIDAGNTGLIFGIPTVIPGAPRTFGLTLRGKF